MKRDMVFEVRESGELLKFMYEEVKGVPRGKIKSFLEHRQVSVNGLVTTKFNQVLKEGDTVKISTGEGTRETRGIKIIYDKITDIVVEKNNVKAIKTRNSLINTDRVIVATGGMSYPKTGSDGNGYILAQKCGHSIVEPKPTLTAVETKEKTAHLMGLSLKNVSLTVFNENGKSIYTDFGEMLFTHFGLSGPIVLSSSSDMGSEPGGKIIEIDLKPALSEKELDERILRDFSKFTNKDFRNSLGELLPIKLIDHIIKLSGIDPFKKVNSITKEERKKLLNAVKHLRFTVKKYRPIDEAIVTSGGIH